MVRLTLVDESSLSKIAHSAGDPGEPPFTTRKRIGATGKSGERRRQIREPARLRAAGVNFRNEIVTGPGGRKSCSRIPPAIWSSCSSRPAADRAKLIAGNRRCAACRCCRRSGKSMSSCSYIVQAFGRNGVLLRRRLTGARRRMRSFTGRAGDPAHLVQCRFSMTTYCVRACRQSACKKSLGL